MRTNCLPIYLPEPYYTQLERRGEANERDPIQEARWILKRALREDTSAQVPADRLTTTAPTVPVEVA